MKVVIGLFRDRSPSRSLGRLSRREMKERTIRSKKTRTMGSQCGRKGEFCEKRKKVGEPRNKRFSPTAVQAACGAKDGENRAAKKF